MKNSVSKKAIAAVAGLLISVATASAQETRVYIRGDIGPVWTDKAELKEFATESVAGAELKFDTGARFGVAGGYQINDWFAAELETGVLFNWVDSAGVPTSGDLAISQVPMLANVVFQCPKWKRFVPFIGGGLGGSAAVFDADDFVIGTTEADGSFSDLVFAYQGFAGLRYDINAQMGVSIAYKYFHADGADWDPDVTIGTSGDIRLKETDSHSVQFAFTFRF